MSNFYLNTLKKNTLTENGAISNSSMGSELLDQFGKGGTYMNRDLETVFRDQEYLWNENPLMGLRFPFYLRMVTRKLKVNDGFVTDKVQKGQGLKDETFKRLLWIAMNHKDVFYNNIWVLPLVGSWKDIWMLMYYDKMFNTNCIDRNIMFNLIGQGLSCDVHKDLIKKYIPRIKFNNRCKTQWSKTTNKLAKDLAKFFGWSEKEFNKFKSSGIAHDFQKKICGGLYDKLNWNLVPGKALNLIVNSKFLKNHNLEASYMEWLEKQPTAKFTGYAYELALNVYQNGFRMSDYKKMTFNKQFQQLLETAKKDGKVKENVLCALDTSGSMGWDTLNNRKGLTPMVVANSLAVFFASLNEGTFHNKIIEFNSTSKLYDLKHDNFVDNLYDLPNYAMGGTNFQSVVNCIVETRRKNPQIPLEEYPTTILAVSDMQFNPVGGNEKTNYEAMKEKLYTVFPKEFVDSMKFVWWYCTSRSGCEDFPTTMSDSGSYVISGFDGSIITLLLGQEVNEKGEVKRPTMEEVVCDALSQEILNQINL